MNINKLKIAKMALDRLSLKFELPENFSPIIFPHKKFTSKEYRISLTTDEPKKIHLVKLKHLTQNRKYILELKFNSFISNDGRIQYDGYHINNLFVKDDDLYIILGKDFTTFKKSLISFRLTFEGKVYYRNNEIMCVKDVNLINNYITYKDDKIPIDIPNHKIHQYFSFSIAEKSLHILSLKLFVEEMAEIYDVKVNLDLYDAKQAYSSPLLKLKDPNSDQEMDRIVVFGSKEIQMCNSLLEYFDSDFINNQLSNGSKIHIPVDPPRVFNDHLILDAQLLYILDFINSKKLEHYKMAFIIKEYSKLKNIKILN